MLNIEIKDKKQEKVEAGQVRYNENGMHVLIVHNSTCLFDAIVVAAGETSARRFARNSIGQEESSIRKVYPYLANATLTIS